MKGTKITLTVLTAFLLVIGIGAYNQVRAQEKTLVIKASHGGSPGHPWDLAMKKYAELLETRTKGKVKIEIFPNFQLAGGNERTTTEQVMTGTQQMALFPTSLAGEKYSVFGLPFLLPNRQKIYEICDGRVGQELLDMQGSLGLKALVFWENGYRQITNSKRPILKPDDMKGLKIRVPHAPHLLESVKALGAIPVPISMGELYVALQQGTADGQENPFSTIYNNKLYEVQKFVSVVNYSWSPLTLALNKSFFDKLPPDVQKVMSDTGKEVAPYARNLIQEEDKFLAKKLEEAGIKVAYLSEEQIALFREATKIVISKLESRVGKEMIKKFQDAAK